MTTIIWELIQPFAGWLIGALVALGGVWGYGRVQKRQGAVAARNEAAAKAAKANEDAHDRINQADTGAGLDDDDRVARLRDFAAKHGTGSPKAGGR